MAENPGENLRVFCLFEGIINVLAGAAMILQAITGNNIMSPDIQALILTIINLMLRVVTNTELTKQLKP
jgi:hypothetical protein